jgi:hypothetical protein
VGAPEADLGSLQWRFVFHALIIARFRPQAKGVTRPAEVRLSAFLLLGEPF